jgi:diphthine-ammonia ligase
MPNPHSLPGVKHKVIGLVSGGKDSTFNLLHCVANGHELVALATLTPEVGVGESTVDGTVLEHTRSIDTG